jgi:hypothetical protein
MACSGGPLAASVWKDRQWRFLTEAAIELSHVSQVGMDRFSNFEEPHRSVFGGTLLLRGLAMFSRQTTLVEFANTNTIDTRRPL